MANRPSALFRVLFLLFVCVGFSNNASLSIYEQQKYKSLLQGQGLYTADDDVEILTVHNFNSRVYGQNYGWAIEFYNSWCGFCQRFAPSWKAIATDLKRWKNVVKIGAVDCADDDNSPVCRKFDIMGVPTIRYFHEGYVEGPMNIGTDVQKGDDMSGHKRFLIDDFVREQVEGRGKMFPNLLLYNYTDLTHLFDSAPVNTKYAFLIIDDKTSGDRTGIEVIMDLNAVPNVYIHHASRDNLPLVKSLKVIHFPYLLRVSDDNKLQPSNADTRETMRDEILHFLKPNEQDPGQDNVDDIFTGKYLEVKVPDIATLMEAKQKQALRTKIKKMGDVIFQSDLEAALRYSLTHEVTIPMEISGDKRQALLGYINVILKYFPLTPNGRRFMNDLYDKVVQSNAIQESDLVAFVKRIDEPDSNIFTSSAKWMACEGSTTKFRGYPCGLWTMFHYLTVAAAETSGISNGNEVLHAMHGYIKHFFGCSDCSNHFQEMAARNEITAPKTTDSAIIWLWMSHNEVNKRLSGDHSEDPEHPKRQFPSAANCPQCKDTAGSWVITAVLQYLKQMYSDANVRYIGADWTILHKNGESLASNGSGSMLLGGGGMFQRIDASMCFLLYLLSFSLLLVLIRMFLKRGYRKKMYVHDLLGKV